MGDVIQFPKRPFANDDPVLEELVRLGYLQPRQLNDDEAIDQAEDAWFQDSREAGSHK